MRNGEESVCPAARCAPRRCRSDASGHSPNASMARVTISPRGNVTRRARPGARLARPGRLRRPRASRRLVTAALRAPTVSASPSTGSRTARCTTKRIGVSAGARAPAERDRTSLRTAPGTAVRTSADSTASAFDSVLRTTARGSGRIARHSSAVAAPLRRVPRRRFPHHECRLSVLFWTPEAARFSHPTHRRCCRARCASAPPEPPICRQTPPGGVLCMLDRVDALEMRGQGADIIEVCVARFSGEPAPMLWSIADFGPRCSRASPPQGRGSLE